MAGRCCSCTRVRSCSRDVHGWTCWLGDIVLIAPHLHIRDGELDSATLAQQRRRSGIPVSRSGRHFGSRQCGAGHAAADLGGWVAAEMAVRTTQDFGCLVLADPLGIKVGGVMDRDIADMHAMPREEYMRLAWADPVRGEITTTRSCRRPSLPRSRAAAKHSPLFGWKPYMHNPRLKHWLRIASMCPRLCCGVNRTASSAVNTARLGAPRLPDRGSRPSRMPDISRTGNSRRRLPRQCRGLHRHPLGRVHQCAAGISRR